MKIYVFAMLIVMVVSSSGCATRSSVKVSGITAQPTSPTLVRTAPQDIIVTEDDIREKPYESLGEIHVRVSKTTIFNKDPTREMVAEKLKEKAADMGADAVIFVDYGEVGMSAMSWGKLDGRGTAIKFTVEE